MTLESLQDVVMTLRTRGVPSALEYPGYIEITGLFGRLQCGSSNETWMCDVLMPCTGSGEEINEETLETIASAIPRESEDVVAVAGWIEQVYRTQRELEYNHGKR